MNCTVSAKLALGFAFAFLIRVERLDAAAYTYDVTAAEECRVRDGAPNVLAKLKAGGPVRIAYLGGSITAAAGWRIKTLAWFKERYPQAEVAEINAAISGTGSSFGACRVQSDVLSKNPDLVFIEYRVNGGDGFELKSVEGLVRQVWTRNPQADICFVYTLWQGMLNDLQQGHPSAFGQIMETVANAYGIPSIDLGVEVAQREMAGTLVFRADAPVAGKLVFSKDGVHPEDAGHDLYCAIIARSMLKMAGAGTAQPHALAAPLDTANWEGATLLPVTNAVLSAGWVAVDTAADVLYTNSLVRTHGMLRGAVKCDHAGAGFTVTWDGTVIGLSDIPYGAPTVIEAVVDGGQPILFERIQTDKICPYSRFFFLPEQKPGRHTLTVTVKHLPEGQWFYAGQFLIVGTPAGSRNLAPDAEVSVSSQQEPYSKACAVDGKRTTEWASSKELHPWIRLQWKTPVKVGRVVLCDRAGLSENAQGGKILFSDGSTFDADDIPPDGQPCEVRFPQRTVSWLRLDLFSARGANSGLAELEVYADGGQTPRPAPTPQPAPGTPVTLAPDDPKITTVDGVREGRWGGAMWCPFTGAGVRLTGNTGPASGTADIYIDGLFQKTADWYSEKAVSDTTVFATNGLPDGKHLLGVLTRGAKRPESQGTSIHWSRIEYIAGAHPERFVPVQRTRFDPNAPLWLDDRGEPLQCHMGGILYHEGTYYLLGSDWRSKHLPGFPCNWLKNVGFAVYSSPDLLNWTYHGNSCGSVSDPAHPLYDYTHGAGRVRPLRAKGTGKFVALFQVVDDTFYEINVTATAVADKPEGPYTWHGILMCDGRPVQGSDTAVFTEDDGTQYLITGLAGPKDWNVSDCLYQLAPDCLSAVKSKRLGTGGEAPALFKQDGVYYLLHSQLTGLSVNDNFYHTATNLWGPWQAKGVVAQGPYSEKTFLTQTMDVVPVAGKKGAFIWIGDSLRNNLSASTRTVWLPVTVNAPGVMELRWRDSWEPTVFCPLRPAQ